jgi:hypothetical protein
MRMPGLSRLDGLRERFGRCLSDMALPGTIGTHHTVLPALWRLRQEMRGHTRRGSMMGWFDRVSTAEDYFGVSGP